MTMKKIIVCGAGHTHLYTLNRIKELVEKGFPVTVVNPGPYHYYSGMGPGLLSEIYRAEQVRFRVKEMTLRGGGEFIEGRAVKILPAEKRLLLENGRSLSYDLISSIPEVSFPPAAWSPSPPRGSGRSSRSRIL